MEESLEGLIQALKKPQNTKKLIRVLTGLRKQVNAPSHQTAIEAIKKYNCLKLLISYTKLDDNIHVIDLTLSILGNCCMNSSVVRSSVNEFNILEHLLRVLEKHKKDSVQGRVFRILGNICDSYEPINLIANEPKLISYLMQFLKNCQKADCSIATISMALRFLRKMLVISTFRVLAEKFEMVKVFGCVLINTTNQLGEEKKSAITTDVLKIFQIITSSISSNYDIIVNLKTTENGDALKCLTRLILFAPEKITKIVLQLAKVSKHLSDLPIEGILANLLTHVEKDSKTGTMRQKELLACICKLLDHLGFHDSFKHQDIITRLIKLFEGYSTAEDLSIQCCIYICNTLNKCKYNEDLVKLQLETEIISIVIEKLTTLTGKSCEEIFISSHDRKEYSSSGHGHPKKFKKSHQSAFSIFDPCTSSDRCVSPSSCSDVSSCGPFSPVGISETFGNDSDSDNYSPLCSEAECEEEFMDNEEIQDLIHSDTDESKPALSLGQNELRTRLRQELCDLLKIYCTLKPINKTLGDSKLLVLMMNIIFDSSVAEDKAEKEYSIIKSISLCRDFFIEFLVSGTISQVYDVLERTHGGKCLDCDILHNKCEKVIANFVTSGQSKNINGEIAYILQTYQNQEIKNNIAISIPYVVRNKIPLMKLMVDYGGLNLIIALLKSETDHSIIDRCLKSICTLATINLKIRNPVLNKQRKKHHHHHKGGCSKSGHLVKVPLYSPNEHCDNEVIFVMDDGSHVKANRQRLSAKSDYFKALLSGSFCESNQNKIEIRKTSSETFKCLMQLLSYDINLLLTLETDYPLDVILDAILLSDQFLLNQLHYSLVDYVQQQISVQTMPTIYKWSIESNTNILRVEAVTFALVSGSSFKERLEMFYKLFESSYCTDFVDDIYVLILQFL